MNSKLGTIVIIVTMSPNHGGKYQYALSILESLKYKKDIVVVSHDLTWKNKISEGFYFRELKKDNLLIRVLRNLLRLNYLGLILIRKYGHFFLNFNKLMNEIQPNKIIFSGGENISYETNFFSICPIFDIMHKYENFPELKGGLLYFLRNIHYRNVLKYCDIIIVDSDLGIKQIIESYDIKNRSEKKIHKLYYTYPNYINKTNYNSKNLSYQNYMVYPAQFWKHKNHINLLRGFKLSLEKKIDLKLILVGSEKNNIKKVQKEIINLDLQESVIIKGYVKNKELVNLYKNAFCLIMPSFLGPTNIPQIEALALKCPVILSDVYAHKEQIEDAALYFNPYDKHDICNKILMLYNNISLRKKLLDNGERVLKKIDNKSFSKNFNKILNLN